MFAMLTLTMLYAPLYLVQEEQPAPGQPPVFSQDELQITIYQPRYAEEQELYETVRQMLGRQYYVSERGGYAAKPVSNVALVGESLLLYDTREYLAQMVEAIRSIDEGSVGAQGGTAFTTFEYSPRHVTLNTLESTMGSFQAFVSDGGRQIRNLCWSDQGNLVVVRDEPARVAEIKRVLMAVDVPAEQVVITCYLLASNVEGEAPGVPAELITNLKKLLPGSTFSLAGFAMLRSTVDSGRPILMNLKGDLHYRLSFSPIAYDPATGSMTVTGCELEEKIVVQDNASVAGGGWERAFSTNAVFRGGEYTVLGATGEEPVFVVVHVSPVGP